MTAWVCEIFPFKSLKFRNNVLKLGKRALSPAAYQ